MSLEVILTLSFQNVYPHQQQGRCTNILYLLSFTVCCFKLCFYKNTSSM